EGLNQQETADILGISKKTVQRRWKLIKDQLALDILP
ncbi:MAG: ECF-type sigma factor, partial [Planctomycetia bacterium]